MLLSLRAITKAIRICVRESMHTRRRRKGTSDRLRTIRVWAFERKWKEEGFCFPKALEYALSQKKDDFAALLTRFAAESDFEGFYRSGGRAFMSVRFASISRSSKTMLF